MAQIVYYPKISDWWTATVKANYTAVYDPALNRTTVTLGEISHQYLGRSGYYSECNTTVTVTATDDPASKASAAITLKKATTGGASFTLSGTPSPSVLVIQHTTEPGVKGVKISADTRIWVAPTSASTTQQNVYGNSSTTVNTGEVPGITELTFGLTTAKLGNPVTISLDRKKQSYTDKLRYSFKEASGQIGAGAALSYEWTLPLDLAKQIPADVKGTIVVYCETYDGETLLGTSSAELPFTIPDNEATKPAATMVLSPVGDLASAFDGLFIRGKTKVKADFDAAAPYSEIVSYSLSVGGMTASGDPAITDILAASDTMTATGTVKDKRGFTRVLTQDIIVHPYNAPSVIPAKGLSSVVCERCNLDGIADKGGIYLLIKAGRKYSTITADGAQKNFCSLKVRYRISTSPDFTPWVTLIAADNLSTDEFSGRVPGIELPATASFEVQIAVEDNISQMVFIVFPIATDAVTFHLREGGNGAAVGKYSEIEGGFEVNYTMYMHELQIKDMADPTDTGDAVPLRYLQRAVEAIAALTGIDISNKMPWNE